jgi:hypothetical protein
MGRIDWKTGFVVPSETGIQDAGHQIFDIYTGIVVTNKPDGDLTTLEMLALAAGETASFEEARKLEELYERGIAPLKPTDFSALFFKFVQEVVRRFREPLCAELRENKDVVLLAPTIVTLLSLPVEIAALAVPVSAILARVGIEALCKDIEAAMDKAKFLAELIKLHEENLRFLEAERSRHLPDTVPPALDQAIAFEEQRISSLRNGQKELKP